MWGNRLLQEQHALLDVDDIIGKTDHDFFRRNIADRIRADDLPVIERGVTVKMPTVEDGVAGLRFIDAALKSDRAGSRWVALG